MFRFFLDRLVGGGRRLMRWGRCLVRRGLCLMCRTRHLMHRGRSMTRRFHDILFCQMKHLIRIDHSHELVVLVDHRNRWQVVLINQCFHLFHVKADIDCMYIGCHDIFKYGFRRGKKQLILGNDTHKRFMLINHKYLGRLFYLLVCPFEKFYGFLGG